MKLCKKYKIEIHSEAFATGYGNEDVLTVNADADPTVLLEEASLMLAGAVEYYAAVPAHCEMDVVAVTALKTAKAFIDSVVIREIGK